MEKPIHRLERVLLILILISGFTLRAWRLTEIKLSEFDEGVYAMNAVGLSSLDPPTLYPGGHRMAPPAYYALVAALFSMCGPSDTVAISINVVLGTLTIFAAWWIGRLFFSSAVGVTGAAFVAWNEYHIMLSRTAMTDIAFSLFFLVSIAAIFIAFQRKTIPFAIFAGIAIALTWYTKYHGWLLGVIAAFAMVGFIRQESSTDRSLKKFIFLWLIMVSVAVVSFLPWILFLQSKPGGYLSVTSAQAAFLGLHWLHNVKIYFQTASLLDGPLSRASIPLVFAISFLIHPPALKRKWAMISIIGAATSSLLIGGTVTLAGLAFIGFVRLIVRKEFTSSTWLLISWIAVFSILTPFYHPYPRLALPLFLGGCLLSGYEIGSDLVTTPAAIKFRWESVVGCLLAILVFLISSQWKAPMNPWRSSGDLADAATNISRVVPEGNPVYVIAEPPLAFYLHLRNHPSFFRVSNYADLLRLPPPVYFVNGIYTKRAPMLRVGFANLGSNAELIATYVISPNDLRILDDFEPEKAKEFLSKPDDTYYMRLYRLRQK